MEKVCANCKWWTRWAKQPEPSLVVGDCRRHAPALFQHLDLKDNREKFTTKWPSTPRTEFCGHFQPKVNNG